MNNKQNRRTAWVFRLFLGFGAGAALLAPSFALAQADPTADETIWGSDNNSSDLLDVIQRGQVGSTQSRAEFRRKQDENLNDAAAAFRARQLEVFETEAPQAEPVETEEEAPLRSRATEESPRPALW